MVKRLCFDTESNYYRKPLAAVGSVQDHREEFLDKKLKFDCGVVFDEASECYHEFSNNEAEKMVEILESADELISHSGPRVDLIVLEHACGEERIAHLHQIKHHDLFDLCGWQKLDNLVLTYASELKEKWDLEFEARREGAGEDRIGIKLAKARYDVERTYTVFCRL